MKPSSRTPEGEPGRCPICGNDLRVDPSHPPGDAPCSYCGSLVWFDSWNALGPVDDTPGRIRLEFHGGCKDRIVFDGAPRSLVKIRGYRYYHLAKTSQLGSRFSEVPLSEYDKIRHALAEYGRDVDERLGSACTADRLYAVQDLSRNQVEQITRELQNVLVHVYEVVERTETIEIIDVHLQFAREARGV